MWFPEKIWVEKHSYELFMFPSGGSTPRKDYKQHIPFSSVHIFIQQLFIVHLTCRRQCLDAVEKTSWINTNFCPLWERLATLTVLERNHCGSENNKVNSKGEFTMQCARSWPSVKELLFPILRSDHQGIAVVHTAVPGVWFRKSNPYVVLLYETCRNSLCIKSWFLKTMLDDLAGYNCFLLGQPVGGGLACLLRTWATDAEGPWSNSGLAISKRLRQWRVDILTGLSLHYKMQLIIISTSERFCEGQRHM